MQTRLRGKTGIFVNQPIEELLCLRTSYPDLSEFGIRRSETAMLAASGVRTLSRSLFLLTLYRGVRT